eukprot:11224289-Lingulodinium_polyedra.AAC.1
MSCGKHGWRLPTLVCFLFALLALLGLHCLNSGCWARALDNTWGPVMRGSGPMAKPPLPEASRNHTRISS